jgi:LacI family gluconate utilization system Gnt-I transcriptional repressor
MTTPTKPKRRTRSEVAAAKQEKEEREALKPARKSRPTIRDVSRLADVSRMTVSRVLSDPRAVSPDTAERVHRAILDLGYVPDRTAGSLASRRTGFIGLMLPTLTNANFSSVAHGMTEVLREANFHLLIGYTDYDIVEEETQIRSMLARRPEALALTGAVHTRAASTMLLRADIPIVEVADLQPGSVHHSVGFSNYQVGRMAAQYLLKRGLRRIGAVGGECDAKIADYRGEERIRGFEDELKIAGISSDLVIRQGHIPVSYSHGAEAIATLLGRYPAVEGVFAVSDLAAVGVILECQRRKISVPDQLSVIGFGDFEIASEIVPKLTTIHVDFYELGRRTGRLLLDTLSGRRTGGREIVDVGLSLVERESVALRLDDSRS